MVFGQYTNTKSSRLQTIGNIYTSILEKDFDFDGVVFESQDNHAFYFEGYDNDSESLVDIKVITDSEALEVWSRVMGTEDWYYNDTIV